MQHVVLVHRVTLFDTSISSAGMLYVGVDSCPIPAASTHATARSRSEI